METQTGVRINGKQPPKKMSMDIFGPAAAEKSKYRASPYSDPKGPFTKEAVAGADI